MDGIVVPPDLTLAIGQRVPDFVRAEVPEALGRVSSRSIVRVPPSAVVLVMAHPGACLLEEAAADAGFVCLRMFDPRVPASALETSADDLVFVGASRDEILWRAARALRLRQDAMPASTPRLDDDGLRQGSCFVPLSASEVLVLRRLMEAAGKPVPAEVLAEALGHRDIERRALEAHVYRLRRKLRVVPGVEIETIRQRGFRWHAPGG